MLNEQYETSGRGYLDAGRIYGVRLELSFGADSRAER